MLFDRRRISLDPADAYGTLGAGVRTFQAGGEFQALPNTTTASERSPGPTGPQPDPWPHDPIQQGYTDDFLHEALNGAPYHGYEIGEWVNPSNPGIPNLGPPNVQPFESGHSQAIVHNQSAEQGWGLDPAILLARYPHSENTNPFYATGTHRRMGDMNVTIDGYPMTERELSGVEYAQGRVHRRSTVHGRLVDNPGAVPYSSTVPISVGGYSAGAIGADEAIY